MKYSNFFSTAYKRLEVELLDLSYSIHFCDAHTKVYSHKTVELILRCGAEIDVISKELFCRENLENLVSRENLKFDFDCCKWFNETWNLHEKVICLSLDFDFSDSIREIAPLRGVELNRKSNDCSEWKKAYMASKHNRINDFKECTLYRLIEAMSALYLLNLVYAEDIILIEEGISFPNELDSVIFVPTIAYRNDESNNGCIYELVKVTKEIDLDPHRNSEYGDLIHVTYSEKLRLYGFETVSMKRERERDEANRLRYRYYE